VENVAYIWSAHPLQILCQGGDSFSEILPVTMAEGGTDH